MMYIKLNRSLVSLITGILLLGFTPVTARADFYAVVPSEYANLETGYEMGEPLDDYGSEAGQGQALQYVIPERFMAGLLNQTLTGLGFRLNNNYASPDLPAFGYERYLIQLSVYNSTDPLSLTFTNNQSSPTTVLDSAYSFRAGAFPAGASGDTPNAFGDFFAFQTTYNYTGGNLLVTIRHSQSTMPEYVSFLDWIPEAYLGDFSSILAHNMDATDVDQLWGNSPVTEFTTLELNSNGTLAGAVPEPSLMSLLLLGTMGFGGYTFWNRRRTKRAS